MLSQRLSQRWETWKLCEAPLRGKCLAGPLASAMCTDGEANASIVKVFSANPQSPFSTSLTLPNKLSGGVCIPVLHLNVGKVPYMAKDNLRSSFGLRACRLPHRGGPWRRGTTSACPATPRRHRRRRSVHLVVSAAAQSVGGLGDWFFTESGQKDWVRRC